jgi:hypothetical protein
VRKSYCLAVVLILLTGALSLAAQSLPVAEVAGGYSYINFHPNLPSLTSQNLNGGGGAVVYNLNDWLGIKAELMDYAFSSNWSGTLHELGYVGSVGSNLFTYQFGPQIKKHSGKLQPFIESLYGGAHSGGVAAVLKARGDGSNLLVAGGSSNAFAMDIGGGLDIPISKTIQIRPVEVDYELTRFGYRNYSANQNNFKYFGGINFTLGEK